MMNIFVIGVLPQADSTCRSLHKLVHDVLPQKRYVLQGTYLFLMMHHFLNSLSVVHFCWSVWLSSIGLAVAYLPEGMFHMELVHASLHAFVCMLIITIAHAIL